MLQRWIVVLVFGIIGAVLFFTQTGAAKDAAEEIQRTFDLNEAQAESAPQQQVVAMWAVRDAELEQIRQNGTRDGLLAAAVMLLGATAVSLTFIERSGRGLAAGDDVESPGATVSR